jgi:hypothetical protein
VQSSGELDPRRPDLREAAETLEQALTEACGSRSAHEADTGELIRVEEMLALASDAARRAISIRRKARQDAPTTDAKPAPEESPELPKSVGEALAERSDVGSGTHRLFVDPRGVSWDVWAVYPEGRPSQLSALPATFQTGWLVFESSSEKRRLSPIPTGWLTLSETELERLCEQAASAPRRTRSPRTRGENEPPRAE